MNLNQWALKWGVSAAALEDLRRGFGCELNAAPAPEKGNNEAAVQAHIRLEASEAGLVLWRNNVGMLFDARGVPVRYGLCNESKQMNENLKSSDLIGIRPVIIRPEHVGHTFGQFVAREVKAPTWAYSGTKHEQAQLRFLELVASLGGDACFAKSRGTI